MNNGSKLQLNCIDTTTNVIEPLNLVLIRFHDNDFHSTFHPLLESVLNYLQWNCDSHRPVPKQFIEHMIMEGIEYHYRFFQIGTDVNDERLHRIDSTIEYLKTIKIMFNKDAETEIAEGNCDNGENWLMNLSDCSVIGL